MAIKQIQVNQWAKEVYTSGALDYALSCLDSAKSFHDYATWLEDQPVANFLNTKDWIFTGKSIVYQDGTEDREQYLPTAIITLDNGEVILHSDSAMSFFFLVNEDNTLDALYVD